MIKGHTVCRETFKFLHAISQNRLTALLKWYLEHRLVPKEKKPGGCRYGDQLFGFEDIQRNVA